VPRSANPASGLWWTRTERGAGQDAVVELCGFETGDHPPGTVLPEARPDLSPYVVGRANPAGTRVRSLRVAHGDVVPLIWWVEHPETSADPPAMTLIAFATDDIAASAVIEQPRFRSLRVDSSEQYGAVRWWPATGQIHQIYVSPARRRQGIGTGLLFAAAAYSRLRGWPLLWGSGERTDLGEAFVTRGHHVIGGRVEARTHDLPPMTPQDRAAGLPRRLLEPDSLPGQYT
jgi:GNAT superfamily N-acetyltransferase